MLVYVQVYYEYMYVYMYASTSERKPTKYPGVTNL